MQKMTLNVKIYQFRNKEAATRENMLRVKNCYEVTSKNFHLKNVKTGELLGDGECFNLNKLSQFNSPDEVYAIGIELRTNKKPIPRVMEKYMTGNKEIRSCDGRRPQFFSYDVLT